MAVSKAFLKFLYTDNELKNFIKQAGATKLGVQVEIGEDVLSELNKAQRTVMEMRANNRAVQQLSNNATLINSGMTLAYGIEVGFKAHIDGVNY